MIDGGGDLEVVPRREWYSSHGALSLFSSGECSGCE